MVLRKLSPRFQLQLSDQDKPIVILGVSLCILLIAIIVLLVVVAVK